LFFDAEEVLRSAIGREGYGVEADLKVKRGDISDDDGGGARFVGANEAFISRLLPGHGIKELVGGGKIVEDGNGGAFDGEFGERQIEVGQGLDFGMDEAIGEIEEVLFFVGDFDKENGDGDGETDKDNAEQNFFVMFLEKIHLTSLWVGAV
jgi:hypothetical protein